MITLILISHITVALTSLGFAVNVVAFAKKYTPRRLEKRVKVMWRTALYTVVSGIGLMALSHGAIGRSCITLSTFLVVILGAHAYQHKFAHQVI